MVPLVKYFVGRKSLLTCDMRRLDNNTNEVIAIKSVNLEDDSEGIEEIRKEIGVLSTCDSPHIIRYRCSYLVDTKLWIIMDYCALGSLRQLLVSVNKGHGAEYLIGHYGPSG